MRALAAVVAALLLVIEACGGGGATPTPVQSSNPNSTAPPSATSVRSAGSGRGSMSATLDGGRWSASVITTATYSRGTLTIAGADGSNPPRAISFAVLAGGPGTHEIGPAVTDTSANAVITAGGSVWQAAPYIGGSGTITIDRLTATGAAGTFQFNAQAVSQSSAAGSRSVSSGVFDVTFAAPIALPSATAESGPPPIAATIDGRPFTSPTYIATYRNGFLGISAFDLSGTGMVLGIGGVTGPGDFSLDLTGGNGSSAILSNAAGQAWGTAFPGGSGMISITGLTSSRATGTFSFVAVGSTPGTPGAVDVTAGTFDVSF